MMRRITFEGCGRIRWWSAAIALSMGALSSPVLAQTCSTNPNLPGEIAISLTPAGSDIDIGWMTAAHNIGVPGGSSITVCLENCDTTTDPLCDIAGTIEGVTAGTTTVAPPMPLYVDDREVPVCALIQFPPPGITGTANVETGEIAAEGTLHGVIYPTACPECTGATPGAMGTCQGGASPGGVCTTDQITTVRANINDVDVDVDYNISRDCLPTGTPFTLSQAVSVATSVQSVGNPCPNQVSGTNGPHECGMAGCVGVCTPASEDNGGTHQNCCNNGTTACFPGTVTRTGSADAPTPAWPDTTYPKTSDVTIAGAFCVGSVHPILVDPEVGLPGPLALLWPGTAEWRLGTDTTTTTTTTTLAGATTTTTLAACTTPAECGDGDACTQDLCESQVCSNPPLADAVAFAACEANKAKTEPICEGTSIDAKLSAAIQKALNTANTKLAGIGETTGKKRTKALKKARAALTKLQKKVTKAVNKKKNPLPQECADELSALLSELLGLIPTS
jgi:hypothetical protein